MQILFYLFTLISASDYSQVIANATIYYTLAQILYTVFTLFILLVGSKQLTKLNENLRINSLSTMIELEKELNIRSEKLYEVSMKIQKSAIRNPYIANVQKEVYERETQVAIQNYLNVLDRICFCIKNKYINELEWKPEYINEVIDAVDYNKEYFTNISDYSNIIYLYNKWRN